MLEKKIEKKEYIGQEQKECSHYKNSQTASYESQKSSILASYWLTTTDQDKLSALILTQSHIMCLSRFDLVLEYNINYCLMR